MSTVLSVHQKREKDRVSGLSAPRGKHSFSTIRVVAGIMIIIARRSFDEE